MTYFPACASSEEEGPTNFTPPVMGAETRRLMESRRKLSVLDKLTRETAKFHETMALKHGLNTTRGLAHYRIAKAHREAKTKLQEFIDDPKRQVGGGHSELGELDPKAIIAANTAAVKFHKQSADKAGLDTDEGHAHVAAMEHHADIIKQAQQLQKKGRQGEAKFGHSSKKSPFPGVPRKKDIPNEDIHQDKPALPLRKLQQQRASQYLAPRYEKSHQSEGGPGSGPRKGGDRRVSSRISGLPSDRPPEGMLDRRKPKGKSPSRRSVSTQHIVKFYDKHPGAMAGQVAKSLSKKFGISEDSALTKVSNFLDREASGPLDD